MGVDFQAMKVTKVKTPTGEVRAAIELDAAAAAMLTEMCQRTSAPAQIARNLADLFDAAKEAARITGPAPATALSPVPAQPPAG